MNHRACMITNRDLSGGLEGKAGPDIHHLVPDGGLVSREDFQRYMVARLSALGNSGGIPKIVALVHGYSTSWDEACAQADAFQDSLQERLEPGSAGVVVVGFSWPSHGHLVDYLNDRQAARASAEAFAVVFLRSLRFLEAIDCPSDLCLVAHSMGNYLLSHGLLHAHEYLGKPTSWNVFSELLMLGADLDADELGPHGVARCIPVFARRVSVYFSRADGALRASSVKRGGAKGPRLGRSGPEKLDELPGNVVAIDATERTAAAPVPAHGSYFTEIPLLNDIALALSGADRDMISTRVEVEPRRYVIK